jgi:hypothetical protein
MKLSMARSTDMVSNEHNLKLDTECILYADRAIAAVRKSKPYMSILNTFTLCGWFQETKHNHYAYLEHYNFRTIDDYVVNLESLQQLLELTECSEE